MTQEVSCHPVIKSKIVEFLIQRKHKLNLGINLTINIIYGRILLKRMVWSQKISISKSGLQLAKDYNT